jgi:peptidoglycan/xylan/chitin deacetylase (PgdA/CDA1 family)
VPLDLLRRTAKAVVERTAAVRARALLARNERPRTVVLAFHNVVPDDAETAVVDESLHMHVGRFSALLDALAELPNVQLASRPILQETGGANVRVLVTFDDAYRGALRLALPALAERRAAAVVFVAPGLLGTARTWWDAEYPRYRRGGDRAWSRERERLLASPYCGLHERIGGRRASAAATLPQFTDDDQSRKSSADFGIADEHELLAVAAGGAISLACHSMHHPCLPALSREEIRAQYSGSLDWLSRSGVPWLRWHAFPYGRWNDECVAELKGLHYEAAFLVEQAPVEPQHDLLHGRVNVPAGMTPDGLAVRLAHLIGP